VVEMIDDDDDDDEESVQMVVVELWYTVVEAVVRVTLVVVWGGLEWLLEVEEEEM
jgi:hypothetical protein